MKYLKPVTKPAMAHHGMGSHAQPPAKEVPESFHLAITGDKLFHHVVEHIE